jgi:hypothetical protein
MPVSPVITPSPGQGPHNYTTIVDQQGYVIGTVATTDGAQFGSISGESLFLYNGGGPPLTDGTPSQYTFDRQRSIQGKYITFVSITATVAGDTALTFSSAPKTIMPGQAIRISGAGAGAEWVYVTTTYVPSATATVIPLQNAVVNAGQNGARFEVFSDIGPGQSEVFPVGVPFHGLITYDDSVAKWYTAYGAGMDGYAPHYYTETVHGLFDGTNVQRQRGPSAFNAFNAQAVTIQSANTPTAIWTPATGKKFRLMGYWFSTTVAAGLVFHDLATVGTGGRLNIPSPIAAAAGVLQSPPLGNGILSGAANNKLWIDATAATTLTGFVWGTEE